MIHAGIEPVDLSIEKYFRLKLKVVDRKDPSKGFYYTYTEHFTKDVYLRAVSILKELQKKQQIQNNLQGHLSYLIADKVEDIKNDSLCRGKVADHQDYLDLLTLKWEQAYAAMLGYEKMKQHIAKLLRNIKKTRNRLYSICHVICNIYNSSEDIKRKSFKEVAEDFSKMLSKYKILDNGRMIAAGIKETE